MNHKPALVAAGIAMTLAVGGDVRPLATRGTESRVFGAFSVTTLADGLNHPWSLAFLPDGNMLVTERVGRLRIIRQGVLDPQTCRWCSRSTRGKVHGFDGGLASSEIPREQTCLPVL